MRTYNQGLNYGEESRPGICPPRLPQWVLFNFGLIKSTHGGKGGAKAEFSSLLSLERKAREKTAREGMEEAENRALREDTWCLPKPEKAY